MLDKILVANRGEIAVRIIRACKELGIKTVAVYSEADADSLPVRLADESICIGEALSKYSYLNKKVILAAAIAAHAQAIHPGYGFLSENDEFAQMCEAYGIKFIGPSALVIRKMGNKAIAKNTMREAKIPVIPGSDRAFTKVEEAKAMAEHIGYPVMIKAALGGGGKGMRIVRNSEEFEDSFAMAQLEACNSFADDSMYLEHYIEKPRHIEVQLLADSFGNVIHLGERDCSIQRRHQKVIEEAPCAVISPQLRKKIGEMAVAAGKAVGYEGVGTVEFLLDKNNKFYFMEMNTRLQVEHGITELVTGIDIVKEQIRIACGEALSYTQKDVSIRGHAIECRINAENPDRNFIPCPGTIEAIHLPGGKGVRIDTAIEGNSVITPYYDAMLLKLMTYDSDRAQAICKMQCALEELEIKGISTNKDYLKGIMSNQRYVEGNTDTHFLLEYKH